MTPEELLRSITELATVLRADMAEHLDKVSKRCDALENEMKKSRSDAAGARDKGADRSMRDSDDEDPTSTMAQRVAADSVRRGEFEAVQSQLRDLQMHQKRGFSQADANAFSDVQAKADGAWNSLGGRAAAPLHGETIVDYKIRLHRELQQHSKKWKNANLSLIAADSVTFENALAEIRADAVQSGIDPANFAPLTRRKITKTGAGGHTVTEWVGNGTIVKELSRPVRKVTHIGVRQ